MDVSFLDPAYLSSLLSPADQASVKVWAVKVAVVWFLVEVRTKKRFSGLEAAVKDVALMLHKNEEADVATTKDWAEKLAEKIKTQIKFESLLTSFSERLKLMEDRFDIQSAKTNNKDIQQ